MMKKNIFFLILAFAVLFFSCENEGEKTKIKDPVGVPTLGALPNLTLERVNAADTLTFTGTKVDAGFEASADYFLEAAAAGAEFANSITVWSGVDPASMTTTVAALNTAMLDAGFDDDATSSVEFRLRARLVITSGTGAPGSGEAPVEYNSSASTADVTTFGLQRLDLNGAEQVIPGADQNIKSPLGNGIYEGFVKAAAASGFTLDDPESGTSYGASGGALVADGGDPLTPPGDDGWYILTADINPAVLTYNFEEHRIALIGSAMTGNDDGWSADQWMDWNPETGNWEIEITLFDGLMKFRRNGGWAWNMGFVEGDTPGLEGPLQQGGVGNDIPVTAGAYKIIFTIISDAEGYYQIIPQ